MPRGTNSPITKSAAIRKGNSRTFSGAVREHGNFYFPAPKTHRYIKKGIPPDAGALQDVQAAVRLGAQNRLVPSLLA